jgi:hypothetical protein
VQRGGAVYPRTPPVEASALLAEDGPGYVSYRDTVYAVSTSEEVFYDPVYRATAERVADSPGRMEAVLRARFVDARVDRDALSTDARDVLHEATGPEPYREAPPFSSGYRELLTAMHKRPYLDGNIEKDAGEFEPSGTIRYDGAYYEYRLTFLD